MTTSAPAIEYAPYTEWKPEDYLNEYYSEVMPDERFAMEFLVESLAKTEPVSVAVEFGCGPTVHHMLPMATKATEIHMAEYLENNRQEVEKWLAKAPNSHNWHDFTLETLRLEGIENPTPEQIEERETLARQRVKCVLPGDAFDADPLGPEKRGFYPLVASHYCAEGATTNKDEWHGCMRNIASLVAPGGVFILSACGAAAFYCVGGRNFPCAGVTAQDVLQSLTDNGFTNIDIRVRQVPDHSEQGFSSVIFARAIKGQNASA
jgi:hypothetical protein